MNELPTVAPPSTERLRAHLQALEQGLLERGTAVRLSLLAALAGEHVLLIGPPGTAKSELARRLHRVFDGARYFERLLTRFSTPEELFGPLSLKGLEDDRYERLTDGYLPTAGVAFLDEVFKANSAILNALLTLLNEREFDNGAGRSRTPLLSVVGATNEAPADEALLAFHDRFLLRVPVAPVGDASFTALLTLSPAAAPHGVPLTAAECAAVARSAQGVALGDEALAGLQALRTWLASQTMPVSDRRWRQLVGLLKVQAASDGRTVVDTLDLWLLPYVVCADPDSVPRVAAWFAQELLGVAPQPAAWLAQAVDGFEKQLEIELRAEGQEGDDSAGKIALARAAGGGRDNGMTRLLSEGVEALSRRRYSSAHVAARLAQLDELLAPAREHQAAARGLCDDLARRCQARLWLPPEQVQAWGDVAAANLALLDGLVARAQALRDAFAALPVQPA
ncbi:MoxR-like ATPase [Burkholderiales bacterium JOSHI_001]|nr:MoxR-like ATPase [Burkholderiales bacterium JOSHI_001]